MKANGMQIGDYVDYRGQIIKVTSLYDKGGSNEVGWGRKEDTWVNAINVKPIPITPEILEKNGFKQGGGLNLSPDYTLECNEFTICVTLEATTDKKPYMSVCNRKIGIDILLLCNKAGYGKEYKHIFSVNELQHLLRLAGCDKEIIL